MKSMRMAQHECGHRDFWFYCDQCYNTGKLAKPNGVIAKCVCWSTWLKERYQLICVWTVFSVDRLLPVPLLYPIERLHFSPLPTHPLAQLVTNSYPSIRSIAPLKHGQVSISMHTIWPAWFKQEQVIVEDNLGYLRDHWGIPAAKWLRNKHAHNLMVTILKGKVWFHGAVFGEDHHVGLNVDKEIDCISRYNSHQPHITHEWQWAYEYLVIDTPAIKPLLRIILI